MIDRQKVENQLTKKHAPGVKLLEAKINATIKRQYIPGREVVVKINRIPAEYVQDELIKRAKKAGWDLKFKEDPRGGDYEIMVTAKQKKIEK
jgi:hypothetical protein